MAAKCLFLVAFVNLPLFVYQFVILAKEGFSPLGWLYALLWRQVFFTILFVLPAARWPLSRETWDRCCWRAS